MDATVGEESRANALVKRLAITTLVVIGLFVCTRILFRPHDGHGIARVNDGIVRVGWPILFYEKCGFAFRERFYPHALLLDLGCAVAAGVALIRWRAVIQSGTRSGHREDG